MSATALFIGMVFVLVFVCGFVLLFMVLYQRQQRNQTEFMSRVMSQTVSAIAPTLEPNLRAPVDSDYAVLNEQLFGQRQIPDDDYDPATPNIPFSNVVNGAGYGPPPSNGRSPLLPQTEADLDGPFFGG